MSPKKRDRVIQKTVVVSFVVASTIEAEALISEIEDEIGGNGYGVPVFRSTIRKPTKQELVFFKKNTESR